MFAQVGEAPGEGKHSRESLLGTDLGNLRVGDIQGKTKKREGTNPAGFSPHPHQSSGGVGGRGGGSHQIHTRGL